jgi:3-dehydroquinate synthase
MTDLRIPVSLADRSYEVIVSEGGFARAGELLAPWLKRRIVIVTDAEVASAQLPALRAGLAATGLPLHVITVPVGEGSKSWAELAKLCDALLALEIERADHILALGGGVVGDLVGFAAAILKRGCHFVQLPTTLLAQVDSSVGGKTAINTAAGKNLVGAFHQPSAVLIDPQVLDTLSRRQVAAGYAEVVKYGLIDDPAFFAWCEANGAVLLDGNAEARRHAIATSVAAKAAIVADDERETSGRRALLNLGHTFGHALEAETGFSDRLLHGEAVAAGMALAFRFSVARGLCPAEDAARVSAHLKASGLPDGLAAAGVRASGAALAGHMAHDKKASGGKVPFLLARGVGQTFLARDVELDEVAAFLDSEPR